MRRSRSSARPFANSASALEASSRVSRSFLLSARSSASFRNPASSRSHASRESFSSWRAASRRFTSSVRALELSPPAAMVVSINSIRVLSDATCSRNDAIDACSVSFCSLIIHVSASKCSTRLSRTRLAFVCLSSSAVVSASLFSLVCRDSFSADNSRSRAAMLTCCSWTVDWLASNFTIVSDKDTSRDFSLNDAASSCLSMERSAVSSLVTSSPSSLVELLPVAIIPSMSSTRALSAAVCSRRTKVADRMSS